MAKRASAEGKDTGRGFDAKKAPKYVKRIENIQADIDEIMAKAKEECAPLYEDIAEIKKEAHDNDNIPRLALNAIIQKRKLDQRSVAVREKLNDDQKEQFDQLTFAFEAADKASKSRPDADDGEAASTLQ